VAAVYSASRAVPVVLEQLLKKGFHKEEILWAWGTCPLPPPVDDPVTLAARKHTALQYGTVTSYWVRTGDEKTTDAPAARCIFPPFAP